MNEMNDFVEQKAKVISRLDALLGWLYEGKKLGLEMPVSIQKIEEVKRQIRSEKIRVALVGGFSEGKTTVAASWLGKVEDNMKIDADESSDALAIYRPEGLEENCEIVDTPGLFGYKEKKVDAATTEKYEDITKRYISEAHVILYVLNSVNSLKDSHRPVAQWLFRDLNKLPHTIFVMNRFDDVCDIEDEDDYKEAYQIKRDTLVEQLKNFIQLTSEEEKQLNIIGMAANPFSRGLDYWLEHQEQYRELSHIGELQNVTARLLEGSKTKLIENQTDSVVRDIILQESERAIEAFERIEDMLNSRKASLDEIDKDLEIATREMKNKRIALKQEIIDYTKRLIIEVQGTDIGTFGEFYEREIGDDAIYFQTTIDNLFEKYCERANAAIVNAYEKINQELDFRESFFSSQMKNFAKQGISKAASMGTEAMRNAVLSSRNLLRAGLNKVGINVGMKFKPWGAIKLAKGIGAGLAFVGVAMDVFAIWKQHKNEEKVNKAKKQIETYLKSYQTRILEKVNNDNTFIDNFIPTYRELFKTQQAMKEDLKNCTNQKDKFSDWLRKYQDVEDVDYENS